MRSGVHLHRSNVPLAFFSLPPHNGGVETAQTAYRFCPTMSVIDNFLSTTHQIQLKLSATLWHSPFDHQNGKDTGKDAEADRQEEGRLNRRFARKQSQRQTTA